MIPNIIHFVFGLKPQTEEFLFGYYLAVYSSYLVNQPEKIYFYYHHVPFGKWWEKLKKIPVLTLEKVPIPTHFGKKPILQVAHKADKVRMDKLMERGGVYMDIDTISVRPYHQLLQHQVVLGKQIHHVGICNAIMFSEPNSDFFRIWMENYEKEFKSDGWNESSIDLPYKLAQRYPELLEVKEAEWFFKPSFWQVHHIFELEINIPSELITLHLWEKFSICYLKKINGWEWAEMNKHTLYGKIMNHLLDKYHISKE